MADIGAPPATVGDPFYLGSPIGISAYADQQTDAANTFLLRLGDAAAGLAPPVISPEFPVAADAPSISVPTPPTPTYPTWTSPDIPSTFTEVLDVSDLDVAPFDVDPPSIVYGAAPAVFSETAPVAPSINLTFDDPTLTVALPARPDLLSLEIVPFDGLNLPTFDADDPVLTAVEPSIREYTPGAAYTSALLSALQTSLLDRITNGGSGLGVNAENAIWDRGREREARSAQEAIIGLERMETLGYAFPPGVYLDARTRILTETDYAQRGHSREVMVESARLELDNVKHALTTATNLEQVLINNANNVEQRLFEATRYATEAGVAIYNAKVQAFGAMVDHYRAKVQVYEAQVRAEVSRVDAYRAQISAEEAKAQVNRALIEQYKVEIDAALSNIEIYKAEIAGIQTKADIERTKVMVFGEQVKGYVAQINAYTAGVEGFRASIEAEGTKARVYTSQVDAFRAQVDASARSIEARVAAYRGRIDASNARWEGYRTQAQAEASRVDSLAKIAGVQADVYRAEVQGVAAYHETLTKQWQAVLEQSKGIADVGISAAKANAELYVTTRSLAVDAAKVGATVSAQLGAAAINAINWSTSFSHSVGVSNSTSYSNSFSQAVSQSQSWSENKNYNYSS